MSIIIKDNKYAYLAYRSGSKVVHKYLGPIANPEVARKIKELKKEKSVPEEYYYLFWDTDPKKIDMKKNSRYVIEKVLEMATLTRSSGYKGFILPTS